MKYKYHGMIALALGLMLALSACGAAGTPDAQTGTEPSEAPVQTATTAPSATVSPRITDTPEPGSVNDSNGVIGDEADEPKPAETVAPSPRPQVDQETDEDMTDRADREDRSERTGQEDSTDRTDTGIGDNIGDAARDVGDAAGDAARDLGDAAGDAARGVGDAIGDMTGGNGR